MRLTFSYLKHAHNGVKRGFRLAGEHCVDALPFLSRFRGFFLLFLAPLRRTLGFLIPASILVLERFKFGLLALIAHGLHPIEQAPPHSYFDCCVFRVVGKVVPFVWILRNIVKFFARPVFIAANLIRGIGVGFGLLLPGLEDFRSGAGVLKLYLNLAERIERIPK